jgi:hypothetical protein
MAMMAERNQVFNIVGIVSYHKTGHGLDMMNIQLLSIFFLSDSTALTGVVVKFPGLFLHWAPVFAVIFGVSTSPGGVLISPQTFVGTLRRAKP